MRELRVLETKLAGLTPAQAAREMAAVDDEMLIRLLGSSADAVADLAGDVLSSRGPTQLLADALTRRSLPTRLAKLRALKALHRIGANDAASRDAYLAALSDASIDVVEHALFGLVAMQDNTVLDRLREMYAEATGQRVGDKIAAAIKAIQSKSPRSFAPQLHDDLAAWRVMAGCKTN